MNWKPISETPQPGQWMLVWGNYIPPFQLAFYDGEEWHCDDGRHFIECDISHWCEVIPPQATTENSDD
jgi:hypothetical protein